MKNTPSKQISDPWVLPRGLGAADPAEVAAAQRSRLLFGAAESFGDKGYAATTVADIVNVAGVSRKTFYQQFRDKQNCYLALYREAQQELLGILIPRDPEGMTWEALLIDSHRAYFRYIVENEKLARACLLEVYAAGQEAVTIHSEGRQRFARAYAALLRFETGGTESSIPEEALRMVIYGVDAIVTEYLREGRTHELESIEPSLEYLTRLLRESAKQATA